MYGRQGTCHERHWQGGLLVRLGIKILELILFLLILTYVYITVY
jgi:hypothetical protein